MSEEEIPAKKRRPRRLGRKLLVAFLIVLALAAWLNGPGWRWLGRIGIERALTSSEIKADFTLAGTLLGGVRVEKLSLSGGAIRKLEIDAVEPLYKITRVVRGEIQGIKVEKINAVIDLAATTPRDPSEPEKPFDPVALAESLRKARKLLLPMDLGAADLKLQIVKGDEPIVSLDTSQFSHAPGSDEFRLELGTLEAGTGHAFAAQNSVIRWTEESLSLDRFELSPRMGVSNLFIGFPSTGGLSASGIARIEDSRMVLEGTTTSAKLRMEGEPLPLEHAASNFAVGLPVTATLRSLEAEISGIDRTPDQWQARTRAELVDFVYEDWKADTLTVTAAKDAPVGQAN